MSNWKLLVGAAVLAGAFWSGWSVNGWRWDSKWNGAVAQHQMDVSDLKRKMQAEFEETRTQDEAARRVLDLRLANLVTVNDELETELDAVSLVKPEVVIQYRDRLIREDHDAVCSPMGNPFSADFVRLFNQSSTRPTGLPDANPQG